MRNVHRKRGRNIYEKLQKLIANKFTIEFYCTHGTTLLSYYKGYAFLTNKVQRNNIVLRVHQTHKTHVTTLTHFLGYNSWTYFSWYNSYSVLMVEQLHIDQGTTDNRLTWFNSYTLIKVQKITG